MTENAWRTLQELEAIAKMQKLRVAQLVPIERRTRKYTLEIRLNIALLAELEESLARLHRRQGSESADADGPDQGYLSRAEAQWMRTIEGMVARGELDPLKCYEAAAVFLPVEEAVAAENERAAKRRY